MTSAGASVESSWPLRFSLDAPAPEEARGAVIAIGNFDGVHRGHQALLATARDIARRDAMKWGMLTLEPHPRDVFRPEDPVFRLTPPDMKHRLLRGLRADIFAILPFSREMAMLEAEEFVRRFIVEALGAAHVVTGYDFHFGHGRKGSPQLMRQLGEKHGFGVTIVEQVTDDDGIAPFSSSSIRAHLRHGNVEAAMRELGYWWMVGGEVLPGHARGREMGFPTVNIALPPGAEPKEGIYATRVRPATDMPGQPGKPLDMNALPPMPHPSGWFGAGYIGRRPTFETGGPRLLEVHLLDFSGDLYGARLCVDIVGFIREDRKFDGMAELEAQMEVDIATIRAYLASLAENDPACRWKLGHLQHEGAL